MASAHPDCWGRPWGGVVLEQTDPRAWAGTTAFPDEYPNPLAIACHVARCESQGLLDDRIPVFWDFGRVWWERPEAIRPYDEDQAAWRIAREAKRREYRS